jgi:hypothetical protein
LGTDHGVENGEEFTHGSDEGDLARFAELAETLVESSDLG